QVGDGPRGSYPGLQMSKHLTDPSVSARIQELRFLVSHGHEEIGRENHYSSVEPTGRYTNHGVGMFVDLKNAAHHVAVILKMGVPIGVGKDHGGSVLIRGMHHAAEIGLNA